MLAVYSVMNRIEHDVLCSRTVGAQFLYTGLQHACNNNINNNNINNDKRKKFILFVDKILYCMPISFKKNMIRMSKSTSDFAVRYQPHRPAAVGPTRLKKRIPRDKCNA